MNPLSALVNATKIMAVYLAVVMVAQCATACISLKSSLAVSKRPASLGAMSISDPSHLTCVGNDYGYEHVFSRHLEGWGNTGDVLLAISTSGNSPNIIEAVKVAKEKKMKVIGLLGKGGGKLKDQVDYPLIVPFTKSTDRVQEIHIKFIHLFIEGIERNLFPENY